jgi:hypothetical protein
MKYSTYRSRFVLAVASGAVAAGIAASPVGANVVIDPGANLQGTPSAVNVGRPPDISDVAAASDASDDVMARHYRHEDALYDGSTFAASLNTATASSSTSSAFDWSDYAIGLGSGIGLVAFLAGGLVIGRQVRHRVQTA